MRFQKASKYDIHIKHTTNGGMMVQVGCAELSFSDYKEMLQAMEEYYRDPEGVEKVYNQSNTAQEVRGDRDIEACNCDQCREYTMPVGSGNRIASTTEARYTENGREPDRIGRHGPDAYRR